MGTYCKDRKETAGLVGLFSTKMELQPKPKIVVRTLPVQFATMLQNNFHQLQPVLETKHIIPLILNAHLLFHIILTRTPTSKLGFGAPSISSSSPQRPNPSVIWSPGITTPFLFPLVVSLNNSHYIPRSS